MAPDIQLILLITAVLLGFLYLLYRLLRKRREQFLATVEVVEVEDVASEFLDNSRSLYIYLPPDYDSQTDRHYPILYLNDGQDREQLMLHETLCRLFERQQIEPVIVVAVPTNEDRLEEYGTAITLNAQGLGKKAGAYGRFLTEEVMPLINERYRTKQGAADTAVAGSR